MRGGGAGWLWWSALVVGLDQASKHFAQSALAFRDPVAVLPVLNWTLTYNPGAAFSFLSQAGGWQRWLFSAVAAGVSVVLIVWLVRLPAGAGRCLPAGLALILGGALGNLWDRIALGVVVDFVDLHWGPHHWPAFNLADAAISIGAVLLLASSFMREPAKNGAAGNPPGR